MADAKISERHVPRWLSEDEALLFRFTFKHSILLACVVGILAMLFAYVFPWLVPVLSPKE